MTAMPPPAGSKPRKLSDRLRLLAGARRWWRKELAEGVDQLAAVARVKEECELGGRYVFMTSMSAGIAVLGLILSSPAVVIGAMLLSPLMGPIIGAGFALAIWDVKWMRDSARTLFVGTLAAILLAALISFLSPIQTMTPEIASRVNPSLLDLAVALFSGLAGSYAMIRGRSGTIVGVAIAVALMPPLAVVGFGLATWNGAVFGGALMLFITNLVTIAAATAFMCRLYGFRSTLSKQRGWIQSAIIIAALLALAVPLTISLTNIAWETRAQRLITDAITAQFDERAVLDQVEPNFKSQPLTISAVMLTPDIRENAEADAERLLSRQLGVPVALQISQFQVDVNDDEAQQAALAAARGRATEEATRRHIGTLTEKLAVVAGTSPDAVSIDRERRRARVVARPIEGATLAAYRQLEARIAGQTPGWSVELVPPLRPIPDVAIDEAGEPDPDALFLAAWAARRRDLGLTLAGPAEATDTVRRALDQEGVSDVTLADAADAPAAPSNPEDDQIVSIRWSIPSN
ncbi:TIGR00341 family protein [Sphingomicrobium sp. XHP0239]|uniref:TIGR00341 family protein n=1 Tax=Sphingomicrobium maritimum TaxID=3133972 RepID=UPI0031CC52DD